MKPLIILCFTFLIHSTLNAAPPNIVLVFIDDMGWGDFSCFGNQDAKTPQIDRLAKEGVRFEQFCEFTDLFALPYGNFHRAISTAVAHHFLPRTSRSQ